MDTNAIAAGKKMIASAPSAAIRRNIERAEKACQAVKEYQKETDLFLRQNYERNNSFIKYTLALSMGIGPAFALFSALGLLRVDYWFCAFVTAFAAFLFCAFCVCIHFSKSVRLTMGVGIGCVCLFLLCIGWNPALNIDIIFSIVPFICCMYLSVPLTIGSCVLTYLIMSYTVFERTICAMNEHPHFHPMGIDEIGHFLKSCLAGYSVEFIVIAVVAVFLTRLLREKIRGELEKKAKIEAFRDKLVQSFANIVEWNDEFTGGHIKRTAIYVNLIAHRLREEGKYAEELSESAVECMTKAAPLHDIGKITVPNTILSKPGKLTDEEFRVMQGHSKTGYEIIRKELEDVESPEYIRVAEDMALYHHEKWNGTGYPMKISGVSIPLSARIMAAADVLDALLSKRQYKEPFSVEKTMQIFRESSGTHFEPCIAEAVLSLEGEIREVSGAA